MNHSHLLLISISLSLVIMGCRGHGRLSDPPSRASAWRYGFNTPKDYNDNEGFCGGFSHQYETQDGKCGICGDAWDEIPHAHEVGGPYATGTIVRHYEEGQVLNLTAEITANHLGHFEVKICPDPDVEATQECLDMHRLSLADGSGDSLSISSEVGFHYMPLQLPMGLTCDHCVIQWRYVAGNNWGICADGTGALGCGPQEEFRACADVSISAQKHDNKKDTMTNKPDTTLKKSPTKIIHKIKKEKGVSAANISEKKSPKSVLCKGVGPWAGLAGASKWCTSNCIRFPQFCPNTYCLCQ